MRCSSILLVALWLAACGGGGRGADDDTGTSGAPTTGAAVDACAAGWEGCACHEGVCIAGLECLSGFCVAVPGGETTEAPDATTTDAPTTLESSGDSDAPSSSSASSEDDGSDVSSSSEATNDDGPPPECFEGDTYCDEDPDALDDDSLLTCVDGRWQEMSCAEACAANGYGVLSPGCTTPPDNCRCGGYLDEGCAVAAQTYCSCRDVVLGVECDDANVHYQACFHGDVDLSCWGQYQAYFYEDCLLAVEVCE